MTVLVDTGWLSSCGVLLNLQCVKCRVWVGLDEKGRQTEFDGMPHHCTPRQQVTPNDSTGDQ